jgi:asparagine N-glycosylation enzyme membrane subunit Stt3
MAKFTVDWAENKTAKTGKPYKALTIKGDDGKPINVNIFSDWPDFANIAPGSQIEGTLEQNGKYWNIRSDQSKKRVYNKPDFSKVMERKEASISNFQKTKEESIQMAASARDATLIVTNFYPELADDPNKEAKIKEKWTYWKEYFLLGF